VSIWPFAKREPAQPSQEAQAARVRTEEQLAEARALRARAAQAGRSLDQSRDVNHYAMALAGVLSEGRRRA